MTWETIVVALVAGLVSGAINEWRAGRMRKIIRDKLDGMNERTQTANDIACASHALLAPAIARLPKTRAKKSKEA